MGRYLEGKCKLCRREGMKLFLKGTRCNTEKCSFVKRPTSPGMHGARRASKPTYYALQLREKQKVKRIYGMLERQFHRFFQLATKSKAVTGRRLLELLERRLDNVIYRALFASSRNQARQIVLHGFVFIGGGRVDIPSYIVSQGQEIEIRAKDDVKKRLKETIEMISKERSSPSWMQVDNSNFKIKIARLPEKEDLVLAVNEQLIVELYSK
ncbi:MAG: 30S ribosomal protein S4 [Candidatus Omnitrophota bacterium]|nr:MAG: 30S ribosomal protein S4 [Candidatus Omnitrophota bacterium]